MDNATIRKTAIGLAIIGLLDSAYLTWIKYAHQEAICAGIGDCELVNSSAYSELGGLPIALYGAAAYLVLLVLYIFENKSGFFEDNSVTLVFGITFIGLLYSGFLTYVEIAILHAICPYCVVSAIVIVILFILSAIRLKREFT
jgi:uncharacterized membrane protein